MSVTFWSETLGPLQRALKAHCLPGNASSDRSRLISAPGDDEARHAEDRHGSADIVGERDEAELGSDDGEPRLQESAPNRPMFDADDEMIDALASPVEDAGRPTSRAAIRIGVLARPVVRFRIDGEKRCWKMGVRDLNRKSATMQRKSHTPSVDSAPQVDPSRNSSTDRAPVELSEEQLDTVSGGFVGFYLNRPTSQTSSSGTLGQGVKGESKDHGHGGEIEVLS